MPEPDSLRSINMNRLWRRTVSPSDCLRNQMACSAQARSALISTVAPPNSVSMRGAGTVMYRQSEQNKQYSIEDQQRLRCARTEREKWSGIHAVQSLIFMDSRERAAPMPTC